MMKKIDYKMIVSKQKSYIKAYAIISATLLIVMGFYTYNKWNEYSIIKEAVFQNNEYISLLKNQALEEEVLYKSARTAFIEIQNEVDDRIKKIFPTSDDYTALTKQLDAFEEMIHRQNDPFIVSNIDFNEPYQADQYSVLPFRMSIQSSKENFEKFLHLVEDSGSLTDETRLMDISSIKINLSRKTEEQQLISFTVQLNAYFQKSE